MSSRGGAAFEGLAAGLGAGRSSEVSRWKSSAAPIRRGVDVGRRSVVECEIERRIAGLEIDVDAPTARRGFGEQPFVGADLAAHDHDLVPIRVVGLPDLAAQTLRGLQEGVLVAPHEEDFEQLELQVATIRRGLARLLHELGGLIVEAVGDVEIGFGDASA